MKSASSISLSKSWWSKEGPSVLRKSGPAFEKAIEGLERADAKTLERAIAAMEKAAKDVNAEARALEGKTPDKPGKKDLQNTVAVLGKPLERALADLREAAREPPEDDDEVSDDRIVDAGLHGTYITTVAPKLKKGVWSFAIGLPSDDPADMRFNFHRKKGGRALGGQIKKAIGAKRFTFGRAGGEQLAAAVSGEQVSSRTLVLDLEGRQIPGLAKRVKLMLRALKVSAFSRVKILVDGKEVGSADDDTPDTRLDPIDLDAPDVDDADAPSEKSEGAALPLLRSRLRRIRLRRRLRASPTTAPPTSRAA